MRHGRSVRYGTPVKRPDKFLRTVALTRGTRDALCKREASNGYVEQYRTNIGDVRLTPSPARATYLP